MAAIGTKQVRYHEKNVKNAFYIFHFKVKNYNLNVTEIRDSDFKNDFSGIFNFTVGILLAILFEKNQNYFQEYPGPSQRVKKTLKVEKQSVSLKENGIQLNLTVIDTPGFGDSVRISPSVLGRPSSTKP